MKYCNYNQRYTGIIRDYQRDSVMTQPKLFFLDFKGISKDDSLVRKHPLVVRFTRGGSYKFSSEFYRNYFSFSSRYLFKYFSNNFSYSSALTSSNLLFSCSMYVVLIKIHNNANQTMFQII